MVIASMLTLALLAVQPEVAADPAPPSLAGPSLDAAEDAGPSLVTRTFDGTLERLDIPPEEAAVEILDLDEAEHDAVRTIIAARAAILDEVTATSIDLLLRMGTAGGSGDNVEALRLFAEFDAKLAPLHARGSLRDEIGASLPEAQRDRFFRVVDEYRDALVGEMLAAAGADESKRFEFGLRLHMEERFAELTRSYERRLGGGEEGLQKLLELVDATPEQESAITGLATLYFEKTLGMPDKQEEARFLVRLLELLTPQQRNRVISAYRRGEI